tara:strand:- start:215 stop:427 length:213 start_codon:yes stop_codon:yes gene_type:complete
MKLDLKTIGTFLGILALVGSWAIHFGDFYFSTQYRLETLEEKVTKLEEKTKKSYKKGKKHPKRKKNHENK